MINNRLTTPPPTTAATLPGVASGDTRTATVAEYQPLSQIRDPRLAKFLGSGDAPLIQVPKKNYGMMKKALGVMQQVGYEVFPDGPANQKTSINTSGGRSWARGAHCRKELSGLFSKGIHNRNRVLAQIAHSGGGGCGEYSLVVMAKMAELPRELPVFRVRETLPKSGDTVHSYNVIGDWRDPTVGDKAIVVDAWQGIKKVHTFAERAAQGALEVNDTLRPGAPLPQADAIHRALSQKPVDNASMDKAVTEWSQMPAGPIAASTIRSRLDKTGSLWDSVTSTQQLNAVYQSPDGERAAFDDAPPAYVKAYLDEIG